MSTCLQCGDGILYTGKSTKDRTPQQIKSKIYVDMFDSEGNPNQILKTDVLDQAFTDALFFNTDQSQRWNIVTDIDAYDEPETAKNRATNSAGQRFGIEGGKLRTVTYSVWERSGLWCDNAKHIFCGNEKGFYQVDACGNLFGEETEDGLAIRPFKIHAPSGDSWVQTTNASDPGRVNFEYDWDKTANIKRRVGISHEVIDANLNTQISMQPINATFSGISGTGFTVELTGDYGFIGDKNKVIGVLLADATLTTAAGAPIVITSWVPQAVPSNNVYDALATLAAGDYLLSVFINGFELINAPFTV